MNDRKVTWKTKVSILKEKITEVSKLLKEVDEAREAQEELRMKERKYLKNLKSLAKQYLKLLDGNQRMESELAQYDKTCRVLERELKNNELRVIQLQQVVEVFKTEREEYGIQKVQKLEQELDQLGLRVLMEGRRSEYLKGQQLGQTSWFKTKYSHRIKKWERIVREKEIKKEARPFKSSPSWSLESGFESAVSSPGFFEDVPDVKDKALFARIGVKTEIKTEEIPEMEVVAEICPMRSKVEDVYNAWGSHGVCLANEEEVDDPGTNKDVKTDIKMKSIPDKKMSGDDEESRLKNDDSPDAVVLQDLRRNFKPNKTICEIIQEFRLGEDMVEEKEKLSLPEVENISPRTSSPGKPEILSPSGRRAAVKCFVSRRASSRVSGSPGPKPSRYDLRNKSNSSPVKTRGMFSPPSDNCETTRILRSHLPSVEFKKEDTMRCSGRKLLRNPRHQPASDEKNRTRLSSTSSLDELPNLTSPRTKLVSNPAENPTEKSCEPAKTSERNLTVPINSSCSQKASTEVGEKSMKPEVPTPSAPVFVTPLPVCRSKRRLKLSESSEESFSVADSVKPVIPTVQVTSPPAENVDGVSLDLSSPIAGSGPLSDSGISGVSVQDSASNSPKENDKPNWFANQAWGMRPVTKPIIDYRQILLEEAKNPETREEEKVNLLEQLQLSPSKTPKPIQSDDDISIDMSTIFAQFHLPPPSSPLPRKQKRVKGSEKTAVYIKEEHIEKENQETEGISDMVSCQEKDAILLSSTQATTSNWFLNVWGKKPESKPMMDIRQFISLADNDTKPEITLKQENQIPTLENITSPHRGSTEVSPKKFGNTATTNGFAGSFTTSEKDSFSKWRPISSTPDEIVKESSRSEEVILAEEENNVCEDKTEEKPRNKKVRTKEAFFKTKGPKTSHNQIKRRKSAKVKIVNPFASLKKQSLPAKKATSGWVVEDLSPNRKEKLLMKKHKKTLRKLRNEEGGKLPKKAKKMKQMSEPGRFVRAPPLVEEDSASKLGGENEELLSPESPPPVDEAATESPPSKEDESPASPAAVELKLPYQSPIKVQWEDEDPSTSAGYTNEYTKAVQPEESYPTEPTPEVLQNGDYPTEPTSEVLQNGDYPTEPTSEVLQNSDYPTEPPSEVLQNSDYPTEPPSEVLPNGDIDPSCAHEQYEPEEVPEVEYCEAPYTEQAIYPQRQYHYVQPTDFTGYGVLRPVGEGAEKMPKYVCIPVSHFVGIKTENAGELIGSNFLEKEECVQNNLQFGGANASYAENVFRVEEQADGCVQKMVQESAASLNDEPQYVFVGGEQAPQENCSQEEIPFVSIENWEMGDPNVAVEAYVEIQAGQQAMQSKIFSCDSPTSAKVLSSESSRDSFGVLPKEVCSETSVEFHDGNMPTRFSGDDELKSMELARDAPVSAENSLPKKLAKSVDDRKEQRQKTEDKNPSEELAKTSPAKELGKRTASPAKRGRQGLVPGRSNKVAETMKAPVPDINVAKGVSSRKQTKKPLPWFKDSDWLESVNGKSSKKTSKKCELPKPCPEENTGRKVRAVASTSLKKDQVPANKKKTSTSPERSSSQADNDEKLGVRSKRKRKQKKHFSLIEGWVALKSESDSDAGEKNEESAMSARKKKKIEENSDDEVVARRKQRKCLEYEDEENASTTELSKPSDADVTCSGNKKLEPKSLERLEVPEVKIGEISIAREEEEEKPLKRGRGRPRKNLIPAIEKEAKEGTEPKPASTTALSSVPKENESIGMNKSTDVVQEVIVDDKEKSRDVPVIENKDTTTSNDSVPPSKLPEKRKACLTKKVDDSCDVSIKEIKIENASPILSAVLAPKKAAIPKVKKPGRSRLPEANKVDEDVEMSDEPALQGNLASQETKPIKVEIPEPEPQKEISKPVRKPGRKRLQSIQEVVEEPENAEPALKKPKRIARSPKGKKPASPVRDLKAIYEEASQRNFSPHKRLLMWAQCDTKTAVSSSPTPTLDDLIDFDGYDWPVSPECVEPTLNNADGKKSTNDQNESQFRPISSITGDDLSSVKISLPPTNVLGHGSTNNTAATFEGAENVSLQPFPHTKEEDRLSFKPTSIPFTNDMDDIVGSKTEMNSTWTYFKKKCAKKATLVPKSDKKDLHGAEEVLNPVGGTLEPKNIESLAVNKSKTPEPSGCSNPPKLIVSSTKTVVHCSISQISNQPLDMGLLLEESKRMKMKSSVLKNDERTNYSESFSQKLKVEGQNEVKEEVSIKEEKISEGYNPKMGLGAYGTKPATSGLLEDILSVMERPPQVPKYEVQPVTVEKEDAEDGVEKKKIKKKRKPKSQKKTEARQRKLAEDVKKVKPVSFKDNSTQIAWDAITAFVTGHYTTAEQSSAATAKCHQVIKNINQKSLVKSILNIVIENIDEEKDLTFTPPAPPLTPTQQRLIALVHSTGLGHLFHPLLQAIEHTLLPEQFEYPDDSVRSCAQFYAAICHMLDDSARLIRFCCQLAIGMRQRGCVPIYEIITSWPDIMPKCDRSNPYRPAAVLALLIRLAKSSDKNDQEMCLLRLNNLLHKFFEYPTTVDLPQWTSDALKALVKGEPDVDKAIAAVTSAFGKDWTVERVVNPLMEQLGTWPYGALTDSEADRIVGVVANAVNRLLPNNSPARSEVVLRLGEILNSGKVSDEGEKKLCACLMKIKDPQENVIAVLSKWTPRGPIPDSLRLPLIQLMTKPKPKNSQPWNSNLFHRKPT